MTITPLDPILTKVGIWTDIKPGTCLTMAAPTSDARYGWPYYATDTAALYNLADGKTVWMKFLSEDRQPHRPGLAARKSTPPSPVARFKVRHVGHRLSISGSLVLP